MKGGDKNKYFLFIVKDKKGTPTQIKLEKHNNINHYIEDNSLFIYEDDTDSREERIKNINKFFKTKNINIKLTEDGIKNIYGQEIKNMVNFKILNNTNNNLRKKKLREEQSMFNQMNKLTGHLNL